MENFHPLAHISRTGQEQTIYDHLCGTASLAKEFARPFGGEMQAELAGFAHDIGKYSTAFQKRLHGGPKTDHATAGALECFKRKQPFAALAVAGHHGGLPDGGSQMDASDQPTLFGRIKRGEQGLLETYERWEQEVVLPQAGIPAWWMLTSWIRRPLWKGGAEIPTKLLWKNCGIISNATYPIGFHPKEN